MSTTVYTPVVDSTIVEAYRVADTKGKAAMRSSLKEAMNQAARELRATDGADLVATLDACMASSGATAKPPVDYAEQVARHAANLRLAATMLEEGTVLPTGITQEMMEASPSWDGAMPEVSADVTEAVALGTAKITRSADRNSIQGVVDRAFSDLPEGAFLTSQEISNRGGLPGYKPSSGAVSARLEPRNGGDCTLEGVEPARNDKGVLGAVKA